MLENIKKSLLSGGFFFDLRIVAEDIKAPVKMKKLLSVLVLFFFVLITKTNCVASGLSGDDPCDAIALTVASTCTPVVGSNTGATNSTVPDVACDGGSSDGDIWFYAVVPAGGEMTIITSPGTLSDIGIAIYTGANCSTLVLNSCVSGGNAINPAMPYKSLTGLTPGNTIWIRAWDVNNDQTGTFNICVVTCNLTVGINGQSTGCSANPTQICASGTYSSYSWTGGATTSCINVNSTGNYTITVTDANGCIASATHSFTAVPSPTVTITGPAVACSGNNPQLCVPNTYSTVAWSTGDNVICTAPQNSGTYTVTVSAANGCTATDSHSITINTSPTVSITGPPSKCANGSEQLCVPGGYTTYSWSSGDLVNCMTPTNTGTYSVIVTDANNCTASSSQHITVHSVPTVSVSGPTNACPGIASQLCVPGGYNAYSWSNGATTNCIIPATSGTYTATVTDAFGCTGSNSKAITLYPAPSVSITGPSSTCVGTPAQLCTPATFSDYNWSNGDTTACISPNSSGNYTVVVTDGNGCTATSSLSFTVDSLPPSSITGPTLSCNGNTVQLCAPAGNTFYLWSNGGTNGCINTNITGNYSVTVTGANGCTSSSSHSLTVIPAFAMTITGPSTACSGTNVQLCATNGNYTYQWSSGETTQCISPLISGTYTVIATNPSGCTRSFTKGLTVYSPLNAAINGPTSACIGSVVPLCATAGASSYFWSTGATTDCIDVNSGGTYTVTLTGANGCTASATSQVTFSSTFNVNIDAPVSGCNGFTSELCVPSGYTSYVWNTGDTTPCITVATAGNYSVTIHDPVGCVANSFYSLPFNPPPTVNITGPAGVCFGGTVNWCAPAGFSTYQWSNGGTSECVIISQDTTYTVEVTDSNGCYATASRLLNLVSFTPNIFEFNGQLICDTFNAGFTYQWLINGQSTGCSGDTCNPTLSGLYSVIVTDLASNCSETATYNYIVNGIKEQFNPDFSIYPNPFDGNTFYVDMKNTGGTVYLTVYNSIGSLIKSESLENGRVNLIQLPSVTAGVYYLHLKSNTGSLVKRIVATGN